MQEHHGTSTAISVGTRWVLPTKDVARLPGRVEKRHEWMDTAPRGKISANTVGGKENDEVLRLQRGTKARLST